MWSHSVFSFFSISIKVNVHKGDLDEENTLLLHHYFTIYSR